MSSFKYHQDGSSPEPHQIFVFGSNMSGIHGAGAAKAARLQYGAVMGVAEGPTGRCYAIPTVALRIGGPLPIDKIESAIYRFLRFVAANPKEEFFVTRVGCGLAGYHDMQIARFFKEATSNCNFPETWKEYLE